MVGDGVKSTFFKACRWFGGSIWLNEVLSLPLDAFSPTSTHTPSWLEVRSGGRRLVRLRAQALGSARIRLCPPYAVRHTDKALPFLELQFPCQQHGNCTRVCSPGLGCYCCRVSNFLRLHGLQHSGSSILHYIPEFAQTHVHRVSDAIQTFHPLSSPSPPALNLSQHQGQSHELALWIRWPKYWEEVNKITQEKVEQSAQQRARPGQRLPSLLLLTLVGDPPSPVSSLGIFSII